MPIMSSLIFSPPPSDSRKVNNDNFLKNASWIEMKNVE